jgi:predicted ABC-type transport system involved in lysophospholipase L1 biosynthesis ATPase subunit
VLVLDRTLDHLDPSQDLRLFERLHDEQSFALLLVSDDPRIHQRMGRHLHIAEGVPQNDEAA